MSVQGQQRPSRPRSNFRSSPESRLKWDIAGGPVRANSRRSSAGEGWPSFQEPGLTLDLSAQRVQHFSCSGKIDDFVFGVECVDDSAQALLTRLGTPLTCEN